MACCLKDWLLVSEGCFCASHALLLLCAGSSQLLVLQPGLTGTLWKGIMQLALVAVAHTVWLLLLLLQLQVTDLRRAGRHAPNFTADAEQNTLHGMLATSR
jgi:hypothetical protein